MRAAGARPCAGAHFALSLGALFGGRGRLRCSTPSCLLQSARAAAVRVTPVHRSNIHKEIGDWYCAACRNRNYRRNAKCFSCGTVPVSVRDHARDPTRIARELASQVWTCTGCEQRMSTASHAVCPHCRTTRLEGTANPMAAAARAKHRLRVR